MSFMAIGQDDCLTAMDITGMSGECFTMDFDSATYDVTNGTCSIGSNLSNFWYRFTAEGPDLSISTTHESENISMHIIRFTTDLCDPVKFIEDTCATTSLDIVDFLEVGVEYFIEFNVPSSAGEGEFCFEQPDITPAPVNDLPCNSFLLPTNGNCYEGTTLYAEPDKILPNCNLGVDHNVWYQFTMSPGDFFAAQITIENLDIEEEVQVTLGQFNNGCENSFSFLQNYCGPPEGIVIDNNQLQGGQTYFISVNTTEENAGSFEICVQEFELADNASPCTPQDITVNDTCIFADTYFSRFEYDIIACDYTNHTLWYKFDSGTDMEHMQFELDYIAGSEFTFLAIGFFEGNWCGNDFIYLDTYCGFADDAFVSTDSIIDNKPYYVIIGSTFGFTGQYSICSDIDYDNPFINDSPCFAYQLDTTNTCIGGSTEFGSTTTDSICGDINPKVNWYKFETADFGNDIVLDYNTTIFDNSEVEIGYFEDGCMSEFNVLYSYCNDTLGTIFDVSLPDSIDRYYVKVSNVHDPATSFNICINRPDFGYNCYQNDFCQDAMDIGAVFANSTNCVTACTFGSTFDIKDNYYIERYPTTWYKFKTSFATNLIDISLSASSTQGVHFAIFTDCDQSEPIFSRFAYVDDLESFTFQLENDKDYWLAISSVDNFGGIVDVCLTGQSVALCKMQSNIEVISTTQGSPIQGPYNKGETISICYSIDNYDPMSESSCQWLQGIVPYFNKAWDQSNFDEFKKPLNILQNITPVNNNTTWDWEYIVHSAIDNPDIALGDNNNDGTMDICHIQNPNCEGEPLQAGDLLPPGWYATNLSGGQMTPDSTYGDGVFCNQDNGTWEICFAVAIDNNTTENIASLEIITFADGELGLEEDADPICQKDNSDRASFFIACDSQPVSTSDTIIACSGDQIVMAEEDDEYYYWKSMNNPNVEGLDAGGNEIVSKKLDNISDKMQTVTYLIDVYQGNCLVEKARKTILLYPELSIPEVEPFYLCIYDSIKMSDIIDFSEYLIEDFEVDWKTPFLEDDPDAYFSATFSHEFNYTITTPSGCTFSDKIEIIIEDVHVAGVAQDLELCAEEEITMNQIIALDLNIIDSFTVDWGPIFIEDVHDASASFTETTIVDFLLTGEHGCTYADEFTVFVPSIPIDIISDDIYCSNDTITLQANYDYTLPHTAFWEFSNGDTIQNDEVSILGSDLGSGQQIVSFSVLTDEECPFLEIDTFYINQYPLVATNHNDTQLGICPYDSLLFTSTVLPDSFDIVWEHNSQKDTIDEFYTTDPGWYYVYAGVEGCQNVDSFHLEIHPPVATLFEYDTIVCSGDSTLIVSDNAEYFFSWSTNQFSSGIEVPSGEYAVTVSNSFDCIETYDFLIKEQEIPSTTFDFEEELCEGDSTWIVANNSTLDYQWSTGSFADSIQVFAGDYMVTFYDNLLCHDSTEFTINEIQYPVVNVQASHMGDTLIIISQEANADSCYILIDDQLFPYSEEIFLEVPTDSTYTILLFCENNGCQNFDTTSIYIPEPNGTFEVEDDQIQVYPNPTNGRLHIVARNKSKLVSVSILNNNGGLEKTYTASSKSTELDITSLPSGMYYLKIQTTQGNHFRKIVKI